MKYKEFHGHGGMETVPFLTDKLVPLQNWVQTMRRLRVG